MKIMLQIAALALVLSAKAQGNSEAVLDFTSSSGGSLSGTLGWTFQPLSTLSVNGLGAFDYIVASQGPIQVGLWNSAGILLASNTITTGSTLTNQTRYESITPVVLVPGSTYHIGAFNPSSGNLVFNFAGTNFPGTSATFSPDVQLRSSAQSASSAFAFPTETTPLNGTIYLTANFRYSKTVPEPGVVATLCLAGLALIAFRRNRTRP